jgi:hypothetical protein
MVTIGSYLEIKEATGLQQISTFFYKRMVRHIVYKFEWPFPVLPVVPENLVLESNKKEISIGFWKEDFGECESIKILTIGESEGEVSPSKLGFEQIYF